MWKCTCGRENADIGNFCVACGAAKSDVISAQLGEDAEWYYYKGGERSGPVAASEIADLLHTRKIDRKTLVWKAGMPDWSALNQTALNTLVTDVVPPAPLEATSDIFAWLLATLPPILIIIFYPEYIDKSVMFVMFLVVWILNILFWALDIRELKKTNNYLGFWIWTFFLIIPVYLFIRSSKVGKRYDYSITYICLLVFTFIILLLR